MGALADDGKKEEIELANIDGRVNAFDSRNEGSAPSERRRGTIGNLITHLTE